MTIVVPAQTPHEQRVLHNLFELYLYDFSTIEPQPIGADGRFSHPEMLAAYWEDPQRYPFLIQQECTPIGFALVKRGSALAGDLEAMDLAEFFILRSFRRSGIGRQAAHQVWDRFPTPTRWLVRVLTVNTPALAFWEAAIGPYTQGEYVREQIRQHDYTPPREWVIFRFQRLAT
ncbi:MAG: GNAT family N-acetyltransferase [Caldilineaceae bacterium]